MRIRSLISLFVFFFVLSGCGNDRTPIPQEEGSFEKLAKVMEAGEADKTSPELASRVQQLETRVSTLETRLKDGVVVASVTPAQAGAEPTAEAKSEEPAAVAQAPAEEFKLTIDLPTEPVRVVLWHSYRGKEKDALEKLVAEFNQRYAPITIEAQEVPFQALRDKITVTVPRGTGPDLFVFAHNVIGDWVEKGEILVPLGSYIKKYDSFQDLASRFLPDTVKALTYQRSLYGLPLAFKSHALFYNRKLVANPPETIEELKTLARQVTVNTGEPETWIYGLVYEGGKLYNHAPWAHGFGARILDDEGNVHLNSQEMIDSVMFVRSLVEANLIPKDVNDAMLTSMFNAGRAAMVMNGPWFLGEIDAGLDYGVALLPKVTEETRAMPYLGSEGIFLSGCSKNPDVAFQFMRFLVSDEAARTRLFEGQQLVANTAMYDGVMDARVNPALSVFREQARYAVVMPSTAKMQAVWSTMDNALRSSIYGGADAAEILGKAQDKVTHDISMMGK